MFFPRLRRQAKWMFVFLALVFGLGYVVFNVGGTIPGTGVADLLRDNSAGSGDQPSVSEAQNRIEENPQNPDGFRDLSRALQLENRIVEAIPPLERYVRARPKDQEALRELATLYLVETDRLQTRVSAAQLDAQGAGAGSVFTPSLRPNTPAPQDPVTQALSTRANTRLNAASTELTEVARKALRAYDRLVALSPDDASLLLQQGQVAETAGDAPKAIKAYERFLKLVPDDSSAPIIRERLRFLQAQSQGLSAG